MRMPCGGMERRASATVAFNRVPANFPLAGEGFGGAVPLLRSPPRSAPAFHDFHHLHGNKHMEAAHDAEYNSFRTYDGDGS